MITRIDLGLFKCFDVLKLPLANLTLLSGANASGKSTILQALVLLHQTLSENEWSTHLMLNGPSLRMGMVSDVVDKLHGRREIEIAIEDDHEFSYRWTFAGERTDMSMYVESVRVGAIESEKPDNLRYLLPPDLEAPTTLPRRLGRLGYITAERIGPREVYELEDEHVSAAVGPRGESAVGVLHRRRGQPVTDNLALDGAPPTLLHQVQERMRTFFPGCAIDLNQVPQTNAVTLGLRTSEDTDFHRPIHVGFGLTQILPIIVAALAASKDDLLLIENPEVHLHPAGQAQMGQFLADVASCGVQVIVETHSDHVLNGIRRSVKEGGIDPEGVAIHFFRLRGGDGAQVFSPAIDSTGSLDTWPEGFFDQFDKDASYFAGWGE